ncbi:ankyrin repeat-containing domain protein [Amylocarpus encephaloides]|uniref:Ankyrin repeat-containing domain protein n=1 Tax=Amylocarpus encephaloides TaxID=45428 RepID=A0A9P7Y736_9HELO|nr:ankyrin repeat-containing domain protein [Amylocarpus encephaloides]
MYRSLLHQLLVRAPTAQPEFRHAFQERSRTQGDPGNDWNWHVNELHAFFTTAVEHVAETRPVNIFVDALDEASDETEDQNMSHRIVSDFHELNDLLCHKKLRSTICFSCRHFPVQNDNRGREICVERENQADISVYVCGELYRRLSMSTSKQKYLAELQDTIVRGARGVFQWAALGVTLAIRDNNNGYSLEEIRSRLEKVPKELGDVYKHILTRVIDKEDYPQTLRLMRWVCLAERPLSVTEICFAMSLPETEIPGPGSSLTEPETRPYDVMVKRIVSLSGGLVETKQHREDRIVQVIHQSVNDFLLRDGLRFFDTSSRDPVGQGHHQLSLICANYIRTTEMSRSNKLSAESITIEFPFIDYVIKSWFLHAGKAETRGVPQGYLLHYIQSCPGILQRWVKYYRILDYYSNSERRPEQSSNMLHIASSANLLSVVEGLLFTRLDLEQIDDAGNRAIHHACRWGHRKVVTTLLDAGAAFEVENKRRSTPLERAAANGHEEIVSLLLVKGADVNKQTGNTGNALYGAAAKGSRVVVQLLLDNKADVNAQGGEYGSALQAAASDGHQAVVQLLLDNKADADVNAQGGQYGNALQAAAYRGNQAVVQLLLDNKADVNAQGGEYGSALQAAAFDGHQAVVQLLLDNKADVNAHGGGFGNALQAAASDGHQAVVQLLLDNKADVNAQGGKYGNALQAALYKGHQAIVEMLQKKSASIINKDNQGRYPLHLTIRGGHRNLIDLVLSSTQMPDWNCQDLQGCSALHFAASGGSDQIVQAILESKVDVNFVDTYGWTALHWACRNGRPKIVLMLRGAGADADRKDINGWTPIDVATFCQNESLAYLFLGDAGEVGLKQNITRPGERQYYNCSSCYHVSYVLKAKYVYHQLMKLSRLYMVVVILVRTAVFSISALGVS